MLGLHLDAVTSYVIAVIFLATLIRSTLGFGEGLVAVPLLALRIPIAEAAPLAVTVSVLVAGVVVIQDWRHVHFKSAAGLVVSSLFGIPIGLFALTAIDDHVIKLVLGGLIVAFALYSLTIRSVVHLSEDHTGLLMTSGFVSGILGGAYGMNGPPLAIYGALRRWSPQQFRATLQGYFLPASVAGLVGYAWIGLWSEAIGRDLLLSLPGIVVAIALGRAINHRLKGASFLRVVYGGLLAVGIVLLVQAAR